MRIWLVLALIVTTTAAEPLSPGDRKDIATLIERLIAAGFPDATSMSLFSGELKIRATSGPKGEECGGCLRDRY